MNKVKNSRHHGLRPLGLHCRRPNPTLGSTGGHRHGSAPRCQGPRLAGWEADGNGNRVGSEEEQRQTSRISERNKRVNPSWSQVDWCQEQRLPFPSALPTLLLVQPHPLGSSRRRAAPRVDVRSNIPAATLPFPRWERGFRIENRGFIARSGTGRPVAPVPARFNGRILLPV